MKIYGDLYLYHKVIDNLLSKEECDSLIKEFDYKLEFIDRGIADYYRHKENIPELASTLFNRIQPYLDPTDSPYSEQLKEITGMNPNFRVAKYKPGGRFSLHQDDRIYCNGNQSWLTLNIFLNDEFKGGETDFFELDDDNTYKLYKRAQPKPGRGALFDKDWWHRGNVVEEGYKYLLRTDVLVF